jgi:hypothetical protein
MEIGILLVLVLSVGSVLVTLPLRSFLVRLLVLAVVAYLSAYSAYWAPSWFGSSDSQYSSWGPLVINSWFGIGLAVGFMALLFSTWIKRHGNSQKSS